MPTLIDILKGNARLTTKAITFVRATGEESLISFPEVYRLACQRARALHALGLKPGDRVALVLHDPQEFVLTFLGALTGGIVAVPIYPPATMAKLEAYGETVRHVLSASGAKVLITSESLLSMLENHLLGETIDGERVSRVGFDTRLVLEKDVRGENEAGHEPPCVVSPDDLAFLQFTSGSTSRPKGVLVTHANLAANSHAIMFDGLKARDGDRGVCWLPLYHDMGLIGFVVAPLFAQVEVMFLPTASFIRRPSLWLDAIHRFRGTITFAPNFAYALATRAVQERQTSNWDLSCLRVLGCGAEPIQASVLEAFVARFSALGVTKKALLPCYGMAEATLAITFHELGTDIVTDRVSIEEMRKGRAVQAHDDTPALELVGCGKPFPGHDIAIVDRQGLPVEDRVVGEIWFRGPSVTRGYFDDAEATASTFGANIKAITPSGTTKHGNGHGAGWLRTGDLGYVAGGELFICGRSKDLIILNGKNYYPEDIERIVSRVDGIREAQCVAFSRLDDSGAEHAAIVAEGRRGGAEGEIIAKAVAQAVRAEAGLVIDEVHLIKRGTLPKTSSGKVRRRETKRRLEAGELEMVGDSTLPSLPPPSIGEAGCGAVTKVREVSDGIE
ncbi:MAG: fatty acyl-AMP ligase [Polyangiales bacterium]